MLVAKLWWDAPHDDLFDCLMFSDDVLRFGRHARCEIRIGHVPFYDEAVPRFWGEIGWHRGQVDVTNRSETWGLELVSNVSDNVPPIPAMSLPPGARGSPPAREFEVRAAVPHAAYIIRVSVAPRPRPDEPFVADEPASVREIKLSNTRKVIGRALIKPLGEGKPRASYAQIATETCFSQQAVKENIYWLDGMFATAGLCNHPNDGDAPTRVAAVLERHRGLLS